MELLRTSASNPFSPQGTCRDSCPMLPAGMAEGPLNDPNLYYGFYYVLNYPQLFNLQCNNMYSNLVQAPYVDSQCRYDFSNRADWQNLRGCTQRNTMQQVQLTSPQTPTSVQAQQCGAQAWLPPPTCN